MWQWKSANLFLIILITLTAENCGRFSILDKALVHPNLPDYKLIKSIHHHTWICTLFRYGDIAPRSILGRGLTVIWMVMGIMIAAVITATVTDAVTGTEQLDIYKQKVSTVFLLITLFNFRLKVVCHSIHQINSDKVFMHSIPFYLTFLNCYTSSLS